MPLRLYVGVLKPLLATTKPGTTLPRSRVSFTPRASMVLPVKAVIAIGTSLTASSRFWADTTISSIPMDPSDAASESDGGVAGDGAGGAASITAGASSLGVEASTGGSFDSGGTSVADAIHGAGRAANSGNS